MSVILANGGDQSKRRELDFYPTPPEVTHALLQFLNLSRDSCVWEPACGDGAMSDVLAKYFDNVRSSDIRQTSYAKDGVDFLNAQYKCDAIITNPPFNASEQFIRHALKNANIVAMVLKSQYWHAAKRASLFSEYPPAWVLPLTWRPDFLFDQRVNGVKGSPTMECLWTVWVKGETETKYRLLNKPDLSSWNKGAK